MSTASTVTMVYNDRMAGPIAVWSSGAAASAISKDSIDQTATAGAARASGGAGKSGGKAFGFGDLLDIVNPLQHIPIISDIYQHFTGSTIKPSSQIIGDTLYGGVLGGIGSLINEAATNATGHGLARDALNLIEGKGVAFKPTPTGSPAPENGLLSREQNEGQDKDSATVLRYSDLGGGRRAVWERVSAENDRMAGTMVRVREEDAKVPDVIVPVGQADAARTGSVQAEAAAAGSSDAGAAQVDTAQFQSGILP